MANKVFANGMEISCKAANGKSVSAFPDVCFTPPQSPATPPGVPIPYPNTGLAKDSTKGTRRVKITRKEIMLKNKSFFKKSTGDEAGCAPKKGVVTSRNTGKVYFNAWSMDVKFEGQNVVRHLDLTTHNHASFPGNSPTWPYLDSASFKGRGPCKDIAAGVKKNCVDKPKDLIKRTKAGVVKRKESIDAMCEDEDCKKAMKCVLSPKSPSNCCPDQEGVEPTGHHIVPASQFKESGESGPALALANGAEYSYSKAPCICVDGKSHSVGTHGRIHSKTNRATRSAMGVKRGKKIPNHMRWTIGEAESVGAQAVEKETKCPKECTEKQLRKGHNAMGIRKNQKIRPTTAGGDPAPGGSSVND